MTPSKSDKGAPKVSRTRKPKQPAVQKEPKPAPDPIEEDPARRRPHPAISSGALAAEDRSGPDLSDEHLMAELSERFLALFDENRETQVVVFELGGEAFAFPIAQVREILRLTSLGLVQIPNAPRYCLGVVNLRGHIVPVVDMSRRFGLGSDETQRSSRLLVLDVRSLTFGVIVSAVDEVAKVKSADIEPLPELAIGIDSAYVVGILRIKERVVALLDLELMFSDTEHITIASFGESAVEAGAC